MDGGGDGDASSSGDEDGDASDSDGGASSESEATSQTPSESGSCYMCKADRKSECVDPSCPAAPTRAARLSRREAARRSSSRAAGAAGAAGGDKTRSSSTKVKARKTKETDDAPSVTRIAPPGPDEILKMAPEDVGKLDLRQIVLLPETHIVWINSPKALADKRERHRVLYAALKDVILETSAKSSESPRVSVIDTQQARRDLERLRELNDPTVAPTKRLAMHAHLMGYDLVAYREAKTHGWPAVRAAQELFQSESQVQRGWAQAIAKGVASIKQQQSPKGQSGDGRGRRGGRGGKGKGNNNDGKDGKGGGGDGGKSSGGGGGGRR